MSTALSDPRNEIEDAPSRAPTGMIAVAATRAAQEVQAAMIIARQNPRDEIAADARIKQACKRLSLAEKATYSYPRGSETVEGPSIRLAEVLAQSWGNIDFGFTELENKNGVSTVQSYCWDLETNVKQTRTFQVQHVRFSKQGGLTPLTDPRDIYEMVANQAARRIRVCILGIIPGDITEGAVNTCQQTLAGGGQEPLTDRIKKAISAFAKVDVTLAMLERRLEHPMASATADELVRLQAIYNSIRDGQAKVEEFFGTASATGAKSDAVAEQLKAKAELEASKLKGKSKTTTQKEATADVLQSARELAERLENPLNVQAIAQVEKDANASLKAGVITQAERDELDIMCNDARARI